MELGEVETFVRVVEAGSMHGAARRLGLPRSTVSRRVARLEASLAVRLLERTTRRMSLTEDGQRFFERVAPALERIAAAASEAQGSSEEPVGTLRITAPVDFGQSVLGGVVAAFLARHPKVRVEVDLSNRYVDLVQEGFDLAIRAGALSDSSLIARRLVTVDIALFASPDYLRGRGAPQHPEQLEGYECVLFRPQGARMRWRLQRPGLKEDEGVVVEVDGRASTSEFAFLVRLLEAGAGIGPLPSFVAAPLVESGQLVRVLEPWFIQGSPVHLVTASGRHLPAKVRTFSTFLLEEVARIAELQSTSRTVSARL